MDILSILVPVVYIVVGVVLVVVLIEAIKFIRRATAAVDSTSKRVEPILEKTESMMTDLEPAVKKSDEMLDRVMLSVDAANLEIMRVDQILEDVSGITHSLNSAASAVEDIASAPASVMNDFTDKVSSILLPKKASDHAVALGEAKAEAKAIEGAAGRSSASPALQAVKRYYECKADPEKSAR